MRSLKMIAILLVPLFVFWGCAGESAQTSRDSTEAPQSRSDEAFKPSNTAVASNSAPKPASKNKTTTAQVSLETEKKSEAAPTERKIVRNADLQLESDEPESVQQKITSIAESKNGFVVESTQSSSDVRASRRDTVVMTVRVPAEKFAEAMTEIRAAANRVIVETVKSDDVTEEFIDTEARLKAKKALEAQFLEIMKRANTVNDALNVQSELSDVRAEIERIEGRLRFLENQTSLSTIKIRIQTPAAFSANSKGFFYRFGESVGTGVDAALSFVLGLVTFVIAILPFLIFIVLPIYLVIRYLWRKRRRSKMESAASGVHTSDEP